MPHPELVAHNDTQFEKEIITLAPGIWGAVGYAASCQYMIEGTQSVTIVDTSESTKAAQNVLADFRKHCDKPVGRIIYTHSHRDHISGASVFANGKDIPIIASKGFASDLIDVDTQAIAPNKALARRTMVQFGIGLSAQERISLGCGPGDRPMEGLGAGFLPPTQLIEQECDIDLDGVSARLIMAPGETPDHMIVWLPDSGVLIGGDNWYHAFPNLYAIRGTPYRDFAVWAQTLGLMADIGASILAAGHTRPVFGAQQIKEVLNTTREAIEHVMRETAQMMDAGASLDDITTRVSLPDHLKDKPWLKEYYGKIGWSARAFAVGTLGWYDGNPTHLGALSSQTRAKHMADLAGGVPTLINAAQSSDDLQWRLELCDHLIALGEDLFKLKADTMIALAETEINATARNTYLWEAKQLMTLKQGGAQRALNRA